MSQLIVLSAIGHDRTGIVQDITEVILNCGGNIEESRMTTLGAEFAMLMLVSGNWHTLNRLEKGLEKLDDGKTHVVFLPEKSSLGFSSPLGLHQGSFTVTTVGGEQVVSNGQALDQKTLQGAKNVPLPLAVDPKIRSQARLADFIDTVRAYNAQ